ncbi:hypothetical protein ACFE04_030232 [Oxalis oulophora]
MSNSKSKLYPILFSTLVLLPSLVVGECTCESESEDRNKSEALKYKLVAFASILVAGTLGVCIPMLGKFVPALQPETNLFFLIKAFAAGVILSTAFIHVLPDAFDDLTSPCLKEKPWGKFPFTGLAAMVAAMGTLIIDTFATGYFNKSHFKNNVGVDNRVNVNDVEKEEDHSGHVHVHTHATHGHSHSAIASDDHQLIRNRVITQVLELGIVVHSVIIGISLGASESPKTIKPLVVALTFHQFFEGMGLGGCISQANFKATKIIIMGLFFSLTTPIGIAIGIGISDSYDENSPTALAVQGILNAASSGILIYMSLVDLLAADFMSAKLQSSSKLQMRSIISLLLGSGLMSLLAVWA